MPSQRIALLLTGGAITIITFLAVRYGWLNDDALNYIALADHLSSGQGLSLRPSWGDHYWAVFPFGYPLVIAAFKLSLATDAFTASKIADGCLLFCSILLSARWLRLPVLVTAALFLSASMIEIASYSWSENPFIFAEIMALAAQCRYLKTGKKSVLPVYILALLLVCFTRYIGGFLLVGYMLALLIMRNQYPRRRLLIAGLITGCCAGLFVAYLALNIRLTGYPTGMERAPAPETLRHLLGQFMVQLLLGLWMLVPPLVLLFAGGARLRPNWRHHAESRPTLILGLFYLLLLFVLRAHNAFEDFSGRMLMPGLLLLWLGILPLWSCERFMIPPRRKRVAVAIAVIAVSANIAFVYRDFIKDPALVHDTHTKGLARYDARYGALPDGSVLLSGAYLDPSISWHAISPIFSSDRLLFALVENYPFTYEEYRAYLKRARYKGQRPPRYLFDFTEFNDVESLKKALDFGKIDPIIAAWIISHFAPEALVECSECAE